MHEAEINSSDSTVSSDSADGNDRPLRAISSMATRQLLGALAQSHSGGVRLELESVGGVDAARRVREGEPFDLVFLAADAISKLVADGHLLADSVVALARSQVAVAVRAGSPLPNIDDEDAVKLALLAAPSIGYSTGPSGNALLARIERWGLGVQLRERLLQAPAGKPVASLVAQGTVALGFQQRSEMQDADGIVVVGDLPAAIAIETIFSGAVCSSCHRPQQARAVLASFAAPATADIKRRHGMSPA